MITRKQYARLSIALIAPLLALGWWLAWTETILPRHQVINCEEFGSHITCTSVTVTESRASQWLSQNGLVKLWGARLTGGFNHSVVTLGHSELKYVDGKAVQVPSISKSKLALSLPPQSIKDKAYQVCDISPFADDNKKWGVYCSGSDFVPENFYFQDESTNLKFQAAIKMIGELKINGEKLAIRAFVISILIPLFLYLLISVALFVLIKTANYVIHRRAKVP